MTKRIDITLPHHPSLGLVISTEPRRNSTLDDRTPDEVQRDAEPPAGSRRPSPAAEGHTHTHRRGSH